MTSLLWSSCQSIGRLLHWTCFTIKDDESPVKPCWWAWREPPPILGRKKMEFLVQETKFSKEAFLGASSEFSRSLAADKCAAPFQGHTCLLYCFQGPTCKGSSLTGCISERLTSSIFDYIIEFLPKFCSLSCPGGSHFRAQGNQSSRRQFWTMNE